MKGHTHDQKIIMILMTLSSSFAFANSLSSRAQRSADILQRSERQLTRQDARDVDYYLNSIERILRDYNHGGGDRPGRPNPHDVKCTANNIFGKYATGGGCNTFGCYYPGGGCNTFGCYYAGGSCNTFGCISEAPKTKQACRD